MTVEQLADLLQFSVESFLEKFPERLHGKRHRVVSKAGMQWWPEDYDDLSAEEKAEIDARNERLKDVASATIYVSDWLEGAPAPNCVSIIHVYTDLFNEIKSRDAKIGMIEMKIENAISELEELRAEAVT